LDPNFPGYYPLEDVRGAEKDASIPAEFRKLYNKALFPEQQSGIRGAVLDETTAREHEDFEELTTKYFRAKWDFYVHSKLEQLQISNEELDEVA